MAGAAFLVRDMSVVPLALGNVAGDVLVAVQTLPRLCRPVEPHVAVLAFALELGVPLDDLAWHDRGLKPRNRVRLDTSSGRGNPQVLLGSTIERIGATEVAIAQGKRKVSVPNDAVIVCAGGVLPFDLLERIGVEVESKHGTT
jgi:hypothetical protein